VLFPPGKKSLITRDNIICISTDSCQSLDALNVYNRQLMGANKKVATSYLLQLLDF
jgi:hypothetical protein